MVAILVRVVGHAEKQAGKNYTDIGAAHCAKDAIQAVKKAGLMNGYPDGSFNREKTITRTEMAIVATRMLTADPGSSGSQIFPDASSNWAQSAIEKAKAAGIIAGYEDGILRPNQTLTRARVERYTEGALGVWTHKDASRTTVKLRMEASFFMHIRANVGAPNSK